MSDRLHTCMLCEAVCGIQVGTEGNKVLSVRGDDDDPFSHGHICPKATALIDLHDDPDRIRQPLRRVGDRFEPISWDDALNEAAERIAAVQKKHGRNSVAMYMGNPTVHSYSTLLATPMFAKVLGTRSRFSATSVDQLPHQLAALQMLGHQFLIPIPDVDRTQFLLILGANPLVSNGSIMTAPGIAKRLQAIRKRGGRVVVVDPRRTETAAAADEHLFIRPGGDAYLLLAMLEAIFAGNLQKPGRLEPLLEGLEDVKALARRFPAERVAARVGIDAARIRRLAAELAGAPAAVCYGRIGVCTQEFGGLAAWLLNVLNVVTGNFDRAGGAMFTSPAVDLVAISSRQGDLGHFGAWRSRVRRLPEFGGELPMATMAEEMEAPGDGQIRALITQAGNPVLSAPNGGRLDRALAGLDFMVSLDLYKNETTRHAHLILPTTVGLERDHYDLSFYLLSVRNAARWVPALLTPPEGVRHDWQILCELGRRLHASGGGRQRTSSALMLRGLGWLGPRRLLDLLLRTGPRRLSLKKLQDSPHGIDLGPLEPRLPAVLKTKGRRIQLAPSAFLKDAERLSLDGAAAVASRDELLLIGRRHLRSNNSWLHNSERLVKGPELCTLLMHPDDARSRQLADGQQVAVRSRVGEVRVPLAVSSDIAPGVVSLPHGWGHGRDGVELAVAGRRPGSSINDLTDEQRVDPLSGTVSFSGVPVTVSAAR